VSLDDNNEDQCWLELEHKAAEIQELRAIIRRLSNERGDDPMFPDEPCPHLVQPSEPDVCVLCGRGVP